MAEGNMSDKDQPDETVLPAGHQIEEYRIEQVIGSGGFGITYRGVDVNLETPVAIKEYFPFSLASRSRNLHVGPKTRVQADVDEYQWGLDRFVEEARTLARFSHANIVRVRRYIQTNGTAYIVMDFCEGMPLSAIIERNPGGLSEAHVRQYLMPLLDGMEQVHSADMLHRDIKPHNVIVKEDGTPILIDFGAARQAIGLRSQSISTVLTPGYAPIEQYSARGNQGPWTDIYALGALVYASMTGRPPDEATERIRHDQTPKLADVCRKLGDAAFLEAIDWALEPDEHQRPQSIGQWRNALEGNTTGAPQQTVRKDVAITSRSDGAQPARVQPGRGSKTEAGGRWPLLAAVGMAVVAVGFGGWLISGLLGRDRGPVARSSPELAQSAESSPEPQRTIDVTLSRQVPDNDEDSSDFALARRIGTRDAYELYLRKHPDGQHVEEARRRLASGQ